MCSGCIFRSRAGVGPSPRAFCWGWPQLTKFSMLLLYAVWPFLWLVHLVLVVAPARSGSPAARRGLVHGVAIVAISFLTIDVGYLFEGVGIPLGQFEFGSRTLTTRVAPGMERPHSTNPLFDIVWQFRVNRFRGTWLAGIPCPLPEHYVLGFDEQKIETEGVPRRGHRRSRPTTSPGSKRGPATAVEAEPTPSHGSRIAASSGRKRPKATRSTLNGEIRRTGWWYYYPLALLYKIPEGTWLLIVLSLVAGVATIRSRGRWFDEIALWTVPVVMLFSMSFLTDINLGLRYVLPILPYRLHRDREGRAVDARR